MHTPVFQELARNGGVNSGPPSVAHSSGIPNVVNMRRKQEIRPWEPSVARSMMGQFE